MSEMCDPRMRSVAILTHNHSCCASVFVARRIFRDTVTGFRGTQQTVSANIYSEDLLSPRIFGLKYDEKLQFSLARIFVIKRSN